MDTKVKNNVDLMARRTAAVPRGIGNAHAIFAERALNSEIWDVEGNRYIDFCAGIAVVNTGHCHPKVVAAVKEQLEHFSHTCFQVVAYEHYIALAERLNKLAPGPTPKKTFFMNTGAEAVENAVKVARAATGRSGIIAFTGAFHGRSMFSVAMTGKVDPYKKGFGPFPPEIYHAPFPHALHGVTEDDAINGLLSIFKNDIEASRVAAIFIEPVQGEGGYIPASSCFLCRLRKICDEHGILLVMDEVQTGIGRCGKLFAHAHSPVEADIITLAKGLGGGFTLAAIIGKEKIMDAAAPGGLGSTYAGNPITIAAAHAVLDVMEEEQLPARSMALGEKLRARFNAMKEKLSFITEVRGLGAMTGVEFCYDNDPHKPAADIANTLKAESAKRGLLILNCGIYGNVLRVMVPLTISDAILDEGLQIIETILVEIQAKMPQKAPFYQAPLLTSSSCASAQNCILK
jgi:4-aminobutyrate aminotransferase/4-aminobutyrate aminotransferase/(S)-3-amino-2-methylpropionate transaminase